MKLKIVYERDHAPHVDLLVTIDAAATVGDLVSELCGTDPAGPGPGATAPATLAVRSPDADEPTVLDPATPVGESDLASGYAVRVVAPSASRGPTGTTATAAVPVVTVEVVEGPDAGLRRAFPYGTFFLGRAASNDLVLSDPLVSKVQARLAVASTVELVDQNSANGLVVDGGLVPRVGVVDGLEVLVGDSRLRFSLTLAARRRPVVGGAVEHLRSPRVEERYAGAEHPHPDVPNEQDPPVFPWLMMLVPVLMGGAMFAYTGRAITLLFIAMSPMMMLGNYWMSRQRGRRTAQQEIARFEAQLAELAHVLEAERPREQQVRRAEFPSGAESVSAALRGDPLLWTRRPEHWTYLHLRLGTGSGSSRNTVAASTTGSRGLPEYAARVDELRQRYATVTDVPVVEDLRSAGGIGVLGAGAVRHDVARSLLAQLVSLHSPDELVVVGMVSPGSAAEHDWLKWLPHTTSVRSPVSGPHLVDSAAAAEHLLEELEALLDDRLGGPPGASHDEYRPPLEDDVRAMSAGARVGATDADQRFPQLPVVVVLVEEDAPVDRGRLLQLLERAPAADVHPLVLASSVERLPASCRTFVDLAGGTAAAEVGYVRHGRRSRDVAAERLDRRQALHFARRLSAVVDAASHVEDATDLPVHVPLLGLLGEEMAEPGGDAVVDRWRQNHALPGQSRPGEARRTGSLRSLVGSAGRDAMHLDLRSQGPHALVGGTTGAGKSEFLQAWVLGLAAEYSAARVTFLFVDYKGGAAFADCMGLPHQVGLVTDLDDHLVVRALASLRAELRHRERVLNRKKAKDLLELERRGDPDCPPALVIVIDEFAALVGEVPEFVDGVVDVAQRGRSLGLHLVMATQRPAGVIQPNLRANTNLRVALRMADESDSSDVVGIADAAAIDPDVPGRGVARTGPGRLAPFQSAYAGGWSADEGAPLAAVEELRIGSVVAWRRPEAPAVAAEDRGPTDQQRLVTAIRDAHRSAGLAPPRRPWLEELDRVYELADLVSGTDDRLALGMADLPDEQRQQVVGFHPDRDGHLAVYGTGGSGKTGLLRALAVGAGLTPDGGPVDVYGIDMGSGGLRVLDALPHVGAVVGGDDRERVVRLMRRLHAEVDRRTRDFSAVDAATIQDFRRTPGRAAEPRVLLLVDGFAAFRDEYETSNRDSPYAVLLELLATGRPLGLHVVVTADRPASIPGSVASAMPRRVVMRLADETMYTVLDVPTGVLGPASPPGRALVDQVELQVGVLGRAVGAVEQAEAIRELAARMTAEGARRAEPVETMPREVPLDSLPSEVDGLPLLGLAESTMGPVGFQPSGALLVGGGPGSGRSTALLALTLAMERFDPDGMRVLLGSRASLLSSHPGWEEAATTLEAVAELAGKLTEELEGWPPEERRVTVVVEGLADFQGTVADAAVVKLVKAVKRAGHLLVAESETSAWASSWPIFGEVKAARRGLLLQPDHLEGEHILKTPFPRSARREFPPGRGNYVDRGQVTRVQLPLP